VTHPRTLAAAIGILVGEALAVAAVFALVGAAMVML
jgi:hypothetical protein